jgi:cyclic dehypoxanthinyl futalosine synthase
MRGWIRSRGGAEILDDEVRRRISRLKCTTQEWLEVHRIAHSLGMQTTATMMFGCGETFEHRLNHFEHIRRLQEETAGYGVHPLDVPKGEHLARPFCAREATAVEYLKTLAIARLYLENIPNFNFLGDAGLENLPIGLRFGPTMWAAHDRRECGFRRRAHHSAAEEDLRRLIRDAGFIPKQRDTLYAGCL